MDIMKHCYQNAYDTYVAFKQTWVGNSNLRWDVDKFITEHFMGIINMTKRKNITFTDRTQLVTTMDFVANVPDNTIIYALMGGEKNIKIDMKNKKVSEDF